jgi:hypothetical protein
MRSNDAIHGWPFDLIQFSMLMQSMAHELGVKVGTYTHHVGSFHIYEPHWEVAQEIIDNVHGIGQRFPIPFFMRIDEDSFQTRAFKTYRVLTQTLPFTELETFDEKVIVDDLFAKRLQQAVKFSNTIK